MPSCSLTQAEQELMRQVQQAYYQADGARARLAAGETARDAANKAFGGDAGKIQCRTGYPHRLRAGKNPKP